MDKALYSDWTQKAWAQNHSVTPYLAIKWAVNLIKFPDRNYDDDYIVIGEIYLKMNKLDLAFEMFDKAYKSGKARAFKEHDDAWEFYKNYPTTKQV